MHCFAADAIGDFLIVRFEAWGTCRRYGRQTAARMRSPPSSKADGGLSCPVPFDAKALPDKGAAETECEKQSVNTT